LNSIFDGRSVMQRFGDIDQKILSDEEQAELLTFPRAGYGCISTSKRFGKAISDAVGCVRVSGEAVVGEGEDINAPVLLLYKTDSAIKVVEHFGRIVIGQLSEDNIGAREVKAMSARKTGEGNVDAGRHLLDYCPKYGGDKLTAGVRSESFWSLVGDSNGALKETSLRSRVSDVRRALLLVLREAGASFAQDIRDARMLPRAAKAATPTGTIDKLTRQLTLSGEELCSDGQRDVMTELLYTQLKPYLPEALSLEKFKGLSIFEDLGENEILNISATTNCEINFLGRSLDIGLGTVAGMKGETHAASLILESYGGTSRKFDVALGLEYISGIATKK
ncbi:TPA: hypothetical protein MCU40_005612, partial [Klebsiella pneumoniae]